MGDFAPLAMVGTAVAGNIAGAKLGQAVMGGDDGNSANDAAAQYVNGTIGNMNDILQSALDKAISSSTGYTNQAVGVQNQYMNSANQQLQNYLQQGLSGAATASQQGFNQSQALSSPYSNAGMGAIDAYQDSLGLKRAAVGSQAVSQGMQQVAALQPILQQLQAAGKTAGASNPYAMPVAPTSPTLNNNPFTGKLQDYVNQMSPWEATYQASQQGLVPQGANMFNADGTSLPGSMNLQDPTVQAQFQQQFGQKAYNNAAAAYTQQQQAQNQALQSQYNNQMSLFTPYQQQYQALQQQLNSTNPQLLQAGLAASQGLYKQ